MEAEKERHVLAPCPFCGQRYAMTVCHEGKQMSIECEICRSRGAPQPTDRLAAMAWNRRGMPAAAPPEHEGKTDGK